MQLPTHTLLGIHRARLAGAYTSQYVSCFSLLPSESVNQELWTMPMPRHSSAEVAAPLHGMCALLSTAVAICETANNSCLLCAWAVVASYVNVICSCSKSDHVSTKDLHAACLNADEKAAGKAWAVHSSACACAGVSRFAEEPTAAYVWSEASQANLPCGKSC